MSEVSVETLYLLLCLSTSSDGCEASKSGEFTSDLEDGNLGG